MRTALMGLIIMQITLVPDSVTPANVLVRHLNGRHFLIWLKPAIFKFLNFYKRAVIFKPKFKIRHLGWAPFFQYDGNPQFLNF